MGINHALNAYKTALQAALDGVDVRFFDGRFDNEKDFSKVSFKAPAAFITFSSATVLRSVSDDIYSHQVGAPDSAANPNNPSQIIYNVALAVALIAKDMVSARRMIGVWEMVEKTTPVTLAQGFYNIRNANLYTEGVRAKGLLVIAQTAVRQISQTIGEAPAPATAPSVMSDIEKERHLNS